MSEGSAPVGMPLGNYPRLKIPLFPNIPELKLAVDDIPWQPGSKGSTQPITKARVDRDLGNLLDKPTLGGKVTICVLLYGDYFDSHKRCLDSIVKTVPPSRMELRVATNAVEQRTLAYLNTLPIKKLYKHDQNIFKYPAMREMFWDKDDPIETNYVVWFDDNTWVTHPNWLNTLANDILRQRPDVAMYGMKQYYPFQVHRGQDPRKWFQAGDWYQDRHFQTRRGNDAPNGDTIHCCVDWFWALRTDIIRRCDIPDRRLKQRGGHIVIGEQLHQNGCKTKSFNDGKALVFTPPSGQDLRRGKNEPYPWA